MRAHIHARTRARAHTRTHCGGWWLACTGALTDMHGRIITSVLLGLLLLALVSPLIASLSSTPYPATADAAAHTDFEADDTDVDSTTRALYRS
jgi:hypothetical protein